MPTTLLTFLQPKSMNSWIKIPVIYAFAPAAPVLDAAIEQHKFTNC